MHPERVPTEKGTTVTTPAITTDKSSQLRPVTAAFAVVLTLVLLAAAYGGQTQALAVLIGVLAGFSLYHASFGFTAAWRRIFAEQRGVGLRYQFAIVLTCAVSFPLIFDTSARGFVLPVGMGMLFGSIPVRVWHAVRRGVRIGNPFVAGGGQHAC